MQGFVREDQDFVVPVQLSAHGCHKRKLGCERQDSDGTVQDPLQLVGERLADSVEESGAAVDVRCYEGMDKSLRRLLGENTAVPNNVVQADIRATTGVVNLGPYIQVFVEMEAQVAHLTTVGGISLQHGCPGMVNFPSR